MALKAFFYYYLCRFNYTLHFKITFFYLSLIGLSLLPELKFIQPYRSIFWLTYICNGTERFPRQLWAKIFPVNMPVSVTQSKRLSKEKLINIAVIYSLATFTFIAAILAFFFDWQYWLNISVALFIAWFSILKK